MSEQHDITSNIDLLLETLPLHIQQSLASTSAAKCGTRKTDGARVLISLCSAALRTFPNRTADATLLKHREPHSDQHRDDSLLVEQSAFRGFPPRDVQPAGSTDIGRQEPLTEP